MHTPFYFHHSDLFPYQPISPIWMIIYVLSSFFFFSILRRTITTMSNNNNKKDIKKTWLRENILLSFIHAFICSMLLIIGVLRAPEMLDDPLSHSNHFNYALIAFTIGYFLCDSFDYVQNSTSPTFAMLTHHIIVIIFYCHVLYHTRNLGYGLYALSLEINSVFLHGRRLLRWYSPISISIYYKKLFLIFIDICNYITFILFRFGIVIICLRALYIQRNRLDPIIHIFTVIINLAIGIINVILFYRLIKNQLISKSKLKQKEDQILITNNHILLPN